MVFCVFCGSNERNPGHFQVVAFGDSTTAVREGIKKVYPRRLAEALAAAKPGFKVEVINAGVHGHSTYHGRERFERDVLNREPHLVIIQFGINDSCIDVHRGKTEPRVRREVYENNLIYFIAALRARECKVILMTPNPVLWTEEITRTWGRRPYDTDDRMGFNLLNREYAESVRRIAGKMNVPLVDVYKMFLDYDGRKGRSLEELLLDGIHPNDRGHRLITKSLLRLIK
ncbi:MAG: hypothetical protein GY950_03330 [bacterium]|nr:hypothetical protein [bacterium]